MTTPPRRPPMRKTDDELRAIAEAATPGNIWAGGGYEVQYVEREERTGNNAGWHVSVEGVGSYPIGWFHRKEDADYSASFQPSAIIALLDRLAQPAAGYQGYVDAYYEIAAMLDIPAQVLSPREVFETQIKPRLAAHEAERAADKARIAALSEEMERIADLTERWTDSLVSQVNEIARAALGEQTP